MRYAGPVLRNESVKRVIDVLGAGAGLLCLSPVTLGAAIGVRLAHGSPVLFRQERPGLHGRPFFLYKFRTMREPRSGEDMLASDGDRITPLGRFLRASSIDELPSLLNVLKGDMSLVGPRPLLMRYLDRYTPEQARRHDVKPGITGLAQVRGRNALSWEEKFALDLEYVDNWSLLLDFQILIETVWKVVARKDVSHVGHATMPEFMGTRAVDQACA